MKTNIQVSKLSKVFISHKKFKKITKTALDDVSFDVVEGKTYGLIGKNGSGKTTLLKILCGLYNPTCGTAKINGKDIYSSKDLLKNKIGVLFGGESNLYIHFTAYENIQYFGRLYGMNDDLIKKRIEVLSKYFEMDNYINLNVANFSRGMKQKVGLVRSIIHDPEILILDEPSTGLDIQAIKQVENFITYNKEKGKTLIISSHNMDEISKLCDCLLILNDGKLVKSVDDVSIINSEKELFDLMGVNNEVFNI